MFCESKSVKQSLNEADPLIFKLKIAFKKYDRLYYILAKIAGALFVGSKTGVEACADLPKTAFIVNLGSGPKSLGAHIINVDAYPYANVAVCADATHLPFRDGSVDAIICECMLEHVTQPEQVIKEIARVITPGGLVYTSVPFMDPYHASPDDYTRWTMSGVRTLFNDFEQQELAVGWGPTSSLIAVLSHWLGLMLSFGNAGLQQALALFFMVCLSPFKILDFALKYPKMAPNIATGFYFIGLRK
ncbi:class I SAM-dependent methyltransferase [Patescibacteria group bacterium]|nr:class I SAM-dependent methyltransferase [Patescibacteria group bacterium]